MRSQLIVRIKKTGSLAPLLVATLLLLPELTLAQTLNDRLVENLSCHNLTFSRFKKAIRKDFSSREHHLPLPNYGIPFLGNQIANCWSLSRTQRLFFYLGRESSQSSRLDPNDKLSLLNLVRGSEPYLSEEQVREWNQLPYLQFAWPQESALKNHLVQELMAQMSQELDYSHILKRSLKNEIEYFQKRRFSDLLRNGRYILRGGARSTRVNRRTHEQLLANLQQQDLTLVILREGRMVQHVLVVKDFKTEESTSGKMTTVFRVYDSNYPAVDNEFIYDQNTEQFYAPKIMTGLQGVRNPFSAMGVFIVDENERGYVLNSLFKQYTQTCSKLLTQ